MANNTHLDELVDFNYDIRSLIIANKDVIGLMADNPDIDMDSTEISEYESQVKDHDYVDETTLKANAYVVIDTEMVSRDTATMKTVYVYVQVICSKGYMDMDPTKFKGVKGNRRDNICRHINKMLDGNMFFGVGTLQLMSATIASLPTGYTGRTLTYVVPNFA